MRAWSVGIGIGFLVLALSSAHAFTFQRTTPSRIELATLGTLPPAPLLAGEGIRYACGSGTRSCDAGASAYCCPESSACDFENASCAAWR